MISAELRVDTEGQQVVDLTDQVRGFCAGKGDGLVQAFVPHATAALVLIELGSGSDLDLRQWLRRTLPPDGEYRHRHGHPGHGADHLVPALLGNSVTVPVLEGVPALGTWQSVALVDINQDNNQRRVRLSFLGG
ncbi:MAG TPA: secondary thiamine-phosphate synthase enzyme YjbQ [Candidatus Saccharimonadales bacterium]|nr:secondary thiamine-phosphate synthase enzyme YjbQ [Candidatus Saccharimonadales bacterium]